MDLRIDIKTSNLAALAGLESKLKGISKLTDGFVSKLSSPKLGAAIGITAATAAIIGLGKAVLQHGEAFELAADKVQSLGMYSEQQSKIARDAAISQAGSYGAMAKDIAEAQQYLVLAGYDFNSVMREAPSLIKLATAGSMNYAKAADLATDVNSALGRSNTQLGKTIDELAYMQSRGNTSIEQAGRAFYEVAPLAAKFGVSTSELGADIVKLADNGIKASKAGRHMKIMLANLTAQTPKASKALKTLGVDVFDKEGKFIGLNKALDLINEATKGLSDKQRGGLLKDIFGKEVISSSQILMGNLTAIDKLTGDISTKAEGAAAAMANIITDNLTGDVSVFNAAWDKLFLSIGNNTDNVLNQAMRSIVQFGTEAVSTITNITNRIGARKGESPEWLKTVLAPILGVGGRGIYDLIDRYYGKVKTKAGEFTPAGLQTGFGGAGLGLSSTKGNQLLAGTSNLFEPTTRQTTTTTLDVDKPKPTVDYTKTPASIQAPRTNAVKSVTINVNSLVNEMTITQSDDPMMFKAKVTEALQEVLLNAKGF